MQEEQIEEGSDQEREADRELLDETEDEEISDEEYDDDENEYDDEDDRDEEPMMRKVKILLPAVVRVFFEACTNRIWAFFTTNGNALNPCLY